MICGPKSIFQSGRTYVRNTALVLVLAALCCAVFGCAYYPNHGRAWPQTPAMSKGEIPAFAYDLKLDQIEVRLKGSENGPTWTCHELRFAVKDFEQSKNKFAKAFYYKQKDQSKKAPCLVLLPPTGGPRELLKYFAEPFADQGYTVIAFYRRERFFNPNKPIDYNKWLFRQAVIDVRRGIDYFETRPDADTSRVATMGISLGGIIAALATEADGRIKATATVVSSAHLPDLLDTSGYQVVKKLRKGLMKNEKIERDQLIDYTTPHLVEIDPATYADRIDPARMLMINGRADNIIKYNVARRSWETYGKPDMIVIGTGHYSTIFARGFAVSKVQQHFLKVLDLELDENGRVRPAL